MNPTTDVRPRTWREAVEYIRVRRADADTFDDAMRELDPRWSPLVLNAVADDLDDDSLVAVLPMVWGAASLPLLVLPPWRWHSWFARTGYLRDGLATGRGYRAERPPEPLTLYRGATYEHRAGWSWTTDLDVARWYARGGYGREQGEVWTATARPKLLLGRIDGPGHAEQIVNGRRLSVRRAEA